MPSTIELYYELGQHVRESPAICATQLTSSLLLKKLIYFEVMLNILEVSQMWENEEFWLVYANQLFRIAQSYFSTDIIKRS